MAVELFVPAKVNLTLHVTGRREDGYHELDSLVVFADIGDRVRISPADETTLSLTGPMAEGVPTGRDNLVWRAAELFGATATMELEKNLPPAAGIGGGSGDAAATLRALSELTGKPVPAPEALLELGADVPVCMTRGPARMRGVGERVDLLPDLPEIHAVLVNPDLPVLTRQVFAGLTRSDNPPMPDALPELPDSAALVAWLSEMRNDLEAPALEVAPVIGQVFATLRATPGCLLARMSGSGATCFGIYNDAETAASAQGRLTEQNPGWWVHAVRLNPATPG
ncbi:4-(cytidine 5'-diphospho)-2-C-methyl-D-erythritol kinase [Roseovarius salinarum]|uniref:4-(cytidine 5'-diphospho)-2-C-methyl-D-erythritol kinase n=1 Tax=Roseovarius salinarum TaxID=1981892 RepID=UPI000C329F7E|nr:4-(cytidine 5'-diphospho)-2-C-methyl-D-erythritol kinase [Roseovarius salinarum]